MRTSTLMDGIPRSPVRSLMEEVWAAEDVIHLEVGEPAHPMPRTAVKRAIEAIERGESRYTPTGGLPELREALREKLLRANRVEVKDNREVLVSTGGTGGLMAALRAVVSPGDTVLIPSPGWPSFGPIVRAVGGVPSWYSIPAAGTGSVAQAVADALTPATRAVIVNTPSNPLGTVVSSEEAEALVTMTREADVWLVADECYDELDLDGAYVALRSFDDVQHVIAVHSFSKVYAMTGWRLGYINADAGLESLLLTCLETSVLCNNVISQFAALGALEESEGYVHELGSAYRALRDAAVSKLHEAGIPHLRPSGGLYVWVGIPEAAQSSTEFARGLLRDHGVACIPGAGFGPDGDRHLRLSLGSSQEEFFAGVRGLRQAWQASA